MKRIHGKGRGSFIGMFLVLFSLFLTGNSQAGTVCAQVKIEIKQELTLERQAFDAMMRISNGLDTLPINNVNVSVNFEDEAGNSVLATSNQDNTQAKFYIRIDSMDNIADVTGYGSVAPSTTAEIHWLIIPVPGAAENAPAGKLYFVGATLEYTLGGEPQSVSVTPDFITVKPLPSLTLDYFLTREVKGDDPLTSEIEAIEPYTLGVRVQNNGLAEAKNLKIESAQPKIIENEQGLLIGFEIIGSSVDDQPATPTLLTDFGTVPGNSSKVGRWQMTSTLSGEFVEFTATFTHADELGGALTSILEATNAHLLVRDVRVDLPDRDSVRDFLAQDGDVLRVYESDSIDTDVTDRSEQAGFSLHNQSGALLTYDLSFPATNGFAYVKLVDQHAGQKEITRVVRSDGKLISLDNAWTSRSRNRSAPSGWDHHINFFDANTTGVYSVQMGDLVTGPLPPVLQYIPTRTTIEGNQIGFIVEATDPNGEIPALSAAPLPTGAVFADNGDGRAFFNWTPSIGQAGTYTITYTATDGALASSRSAIIRVNTVSDTDGDGMDDAWELEHFGNLERDGSGDFDGDGISDLDEYLNGTDPSDGPQVPVIESPHYGAEVDLLVPVMTVVNITHVGDVPMTYDFELYADAEMTQLVANIENVSEGVDITSWTVPQALSDNTAYTWRVRAYDGAVYSLWTNGRFFVNTQNDPPSTFTISSPSDGAEVARVNPLLAVTNAMDVDRDELTYRFEISEFEDFSTMVASVEGISPGIGGSTGWLVDTPLSENTYYNWRAFAVDEHGLETAGPVAGFFVNTSNEAPLAPVIQSPLHGTAITDINVVLTVENGSDADGDSLSYIFELDRVETFDGVDKQVSDSISEQPTTTQWSVTGLLENVTYYWRVKASDGLVDSAWVGASFSVTGVNLPPSSPTVQNPGDSAWVAILQPELSVNQSVDPNGDSVNYRFEIYSDAELTGLVNERVTIENSWVPDTPLVNNEWYYWRVRAEDSAGGESEWSSVSRFFVDDNGVNDSPTISFIEPAENIEVTTGMMSLRWTDDDPDSSAVISLYYDDNNSGADGTLIAGDISEDSDEIGDLYTWHVETLPPGLYWVYAVIDDGNSTTTSYSEYSINVGISEIVLDNLDANVTVRGEWSHSTSISGYLGSDYQYLTPHGPNPESIILNNEDPNVFSASSDWISSTAVSGYLGDNYQYCEVNGDPVEGLIIDNSDSGFITTDEWSHATEIGGYEGADYQYHEPNGETIYSQVMDNTDPTAVSVGDWNDSAEDGGYYLTNYQYQSAGSGANTFTWHPTIDTSGLYRVYARWPHGENRAASTPYTITHADGMSTIRVDQASRADKWNLLGEYEFLQGEANTISVSDDANGYVIADAVMVVPAQAPGNTATWSFDINETGQYKVFAKIVGGYGRAANAKYVVSDDTGDTAVTVDQRIEGSSWSQLGTFTFSNGGSYQVSLSDQANGYVSADAIKIVSVDAMPDSAVWTFTVPKSTDYRLHARWTEHPNNASNAQYSIESNSGESTFLANQKVHGGEWNQLGIYSFNTGVNYRIRLAGEADGNVIADSISLTNLDGVSNVFSWHTTVPLTGQYEVYARWTASGDCATNTTYSILSDSGVDDVVVNQQTEGARWNLLGTYNFTQGSDYSISINDDTDGNVVADGIKLVPVAQ